MFVKITSFSVHFFPRRKHAQTHIHCRCVYAISLEDVTVQCRVFFSQDPVFLSFAFTPIHGFFERSTKDPSILIALPERCPLICRCAPTAALPPMRTKLSPILLCAFSTSGGSPRLGCALAFLFLLFRLFDLLLLIAITTTISRHGFFVRKGDFRKSNNLKNYQKSGFFPLNACLLLEHLLDTPHLFLEKLQVNHSRIIFP